MQVVEALTRLGGVADRRTLLQITSRSRLRRALAHGDVVKAGLHGFALPGAPAGLRAARALNGVASHESAALHLGWEVKAVPDRPAVIVPRHRTVPAARRHGVDLRFRDLAPDEHDGLATTRLRTVLDCARDLPFDRALAVADSALRHGDVDPDELERLAVTVRTTGRRAALRVARFADGRAANPFESALRAVALEVLGPGIEAQVVIDEDGFRCRPDLVDVRRRLVLEADSYEFHGSRAGLRHDARRYNALVLRGWTVLRFTWEDVMFDPDHVRACLVRFARGPGSRAAPRRKVRKAA